MKTKTKTKKGAGKTAPASAPARTLALAIIGGRRGYGLRTVTMQGKDTLLAANDASGRQVKLASPWKITDGTIERRRGMDSLIVPQYLGNRVELVSLTDYSVKATWTFTKTGKTIPVLVSRDVSAQCTGPDKAYTKRDVVPLVRLVGKSRIPWQGECDTNGNNAHERGQLTLGKA